MLIEAKELSISYDKKEIVHGIDFRLKQGEIISIVGPNGSGKTTVLKALTRLLKPSSGKVLLDGQDIFKMNSKKIAKKIAILPQIRNTPEDFDVETLIRYGRSPHSNWQGKISNKDKDIIEWAMKKTGMTHHRLKKLTKLSGGERQRAWIAMALAQKTEIIVLDEPTTFLDLSHQLEILELVKHLNETENVTILMVLHDLNQAIRYSSRVYVMKRGHVVANGKPSEIITQELLKDVFRIDSDFHEDKRHDCKNFIPYKLEVDENASRCPIKREKEIQ